MIKLVKINKDNKAFNIKGEEVLNFDSEKVSYIELRLSDGSYLHVPSENIESINGGYLKTTYDGIDYILDDGHRFESVLLGYLVYRDYDTENINDKEFGVSLRNRLYDDICSKYNIYTNMKQVVKDNIEYIICIDKINTIVTKNQTRKDEGRKVFPFIKTMDKYGTFYVSIFSKSKDEIRTKLDSTSIIEDILKSIGNEWKFIPKDYNRIPLYM